MKEELLAKIRSHFERGSSSSSSKDYSKLDRKEYESLLLVRQEVLELKAFLISQVELPENEVSSKIEAHLMNLEKMEKKNKKKIQAASDEDFEKAAKYRNQYNLIKNLLLKFEDVQSLLDQKPALTFLEVMELVLQIDERMNFSRNLLNKIVTQGISKSHVVSLLM